MENILKINTWRASTGMLICPCIIAAEEHKLLSGMKTEAI